MRSARWALALAATLGLLGLGASAATARVPQGFAGVVIDGPVWPPAPGIDLGRQLDLMVASGAESIRAEFDWAQIEPYRRWADVPRARRRSFADVDGLPLDLHLEDQLVQDCAQRGLRLLPTVVDAPHWDALPNPVQTPTPKDTAPYARFLAALVHRYGSHGTLWRHARSRLPVSWWQIWNEPNLTSYWNRVPFAPSYVALLRAAHAAIKQADRSAQVVLAGLPNRSWTDVSTLLRQPGAVKLFDVAAVHPYTATPSGVLEVLRLFRHALDAGGARRTPIVVDEFGWPSSKDKTSQDFGVATDESGQAADTDQAIEQFAFVRTSLRLVGFDLYTWMGNEIAGGPEFSFAGLFRLEADGTTITPKPAYLIFRRDVLALEGCATKSRDARRCARASSP